MPRAVLTIGAALCLWGTAVAQDPRELAQDILGSGYQTELPGEGEGGGEAGEWTARMDREGRRRREAQELVQRAPASIGYLPWILLGVAVVVGAVLVVRGSVGAGRDVAVAGSRGTGAAGDEPVPFDPGAEPLDEAERLAREGRFGEAIRILLHRTFDALRARGGFRVAPWMTSREILRRAPLPGPSRSGLAALVDAVERSLFARREPGPEEYRSCARAYEALLADASGEGA